MQNRPLLFDLAQLLEAGMAPLAAVDHFLTDAAIDAKSLGRLRTELQRGRSLASALCEAGFASRLETEILKTAESAGKLGEALRLVAADFERRRGRIAALRARLWLPNTVLFIALAVGVMRATTGGDPLAAALFEAIAIGFSVTVLSQVLLAALSRDATRLLAVGWRLSLQRRSKLFRQFFEQVFYTLFVWQADAGLDYVSGAKDLASLIDSSSYRRAVGRYRQSITRGGTVADALQSADLMIAGELANVIDVGEQSGRLVPALQHYLSAQGAYLDRIADGIFTWLPRIYYLIIVAIAVGFVI